MISASSRRDTVRAGRSPMLGTPSVSLSLTMSTRAMPYLILIFSASVCDVSSPIAMSFVTFCPPIGNTAVWRMLPSTKMARSVVPPPRSTIATPNSRSSALNTASLEASGWSTMSTTSRPARLTHLTMFCADVTAPVMICTSTSSRDPDMPSGSRMPS